MIPEKVTLKQIPDSQAEGSGLAKYNRSRMPRTFDKLGPAKGEDNRYITGIDENSFAVNRITDEERREEIKTTLKSIRESLERTMNVDLSATSDYWKTYYVDLSSDHERVFNRSNPKDVIAYHVLIANCYAAPSEEAAGDPRYHSAKYFMHSEKKEKIKNVSNRKRKDKAKSYLLAMEEDKDRMLLIGKYLYGKRFTDKLDCDAMYEMFSDIFDKNLDNDIERFIKAYEKDYEELSYKVLIDRAITARIIKFTDGYYQRGQVTLGKSLDEVYVNLRLPEFSTEFMSIKEELG